MNHRFCLSIAMLAGIVALSLLAVSAEAQTPNASTNWTPPKTPWGHPDLQGIYTSDDYIGVGMNRQAQFGARLYLTEEEREDRQEQIEDRAERDLVEFAETDGRVGTGPPSHWGERARRSPRQTSLVVEPEDGQTPELTEAGRQRQAVASATRFFDPGDREVESWENFTYYIRCISRGVAGSVLPVIYGNGTEIVQSPGYVAILQEMVHEARIIPLDESPHVGDNIKSYMGDSRGRWEGNTLVIETTNLLGNRTGVGPNGGGAPLSEKARITERLTRVDEATIQYSMRIEDSDTYTAPFTVSFPIRQEPGYQNFEYACHEGNHGMMNQLSAARAKERQAAEEAAEQ